MSNTSQGELSTKGEAGHHIIHDVLGFQNVDTDGLNDFQRLPTQDLIAIQKVGINRFRLPIQIKHPNSIMGHDATASMGVSLDQKKNGVSMSRLCTILQAEAEQYSVNKNFMEQVLDRYQKELRDPSDAEDEINHAFLNLSFEYASKQASLKSDNWGWQYYPVTLKGEFSQKKGFQFFISLFYEYSSTCPCSLSMAKQYEQQYARGEISEGVGVAAAHGQRSGMKCTVEIKEESDFFIEDLIKLLRQTIPTETQSLVKRQDEQAFAILNGANPMFVEHVSKRIYKALNQRSEIADWLVEIEHYESLHSHNAAACIYKGIEGGLKSDQIF